MSGFNWKRRPGETEQAEPKQQPYWNGGGVRGPEPRKRSEREKDEAFFRDWAEKMKDGGR